MAMVATLALALGRTVVCEYGNLRGRKYAKLSLVQLYRDAMAHGKMTQEEFWIVKTGRFFHIHLLRIREHVPREASVLVITPWEHIAFEAKSHYWLYPRQVRMLSGDELNGSLPVDGDWQYIAYLGETERFRNLSNLDDFVEVCPPAYSGGSHQGEGVSAILRRP